ncbi:hypothetical protein VN12_06475 [Pirellula sp. SH-Sr6A]|nr:hypothetical protein VN12_06475 [Pirellula sp. SH-Sr6A]
MQRVRSIRSLPDGFREFTPPPGPEPIWSVLAECVDVARRVGAPDVTVEEVFDGRRTKVSIRVAQIEKRACTIASEE